MGGTTRGELDELVKQLNIYTENSLTQWTTLRLGERVAHDGTYFVRTGSGVYSLCKLVGTEGHYEQVFPANSRRCIAEAIGSYLRIHELEGDQHETRTSG